MTYFTDSFASSTQTIKIRSTPSGLLLFSRATGTNILIEEVELSPERYSLAPRQVSIALTNICDLACEFCYAPKSARNLPFNNLRPWLRELDRNGTIGVGFGGGEPTLHPKFVEICEFATAETNLAVTFTTHGHRLTPKLLQNLKGNINFVRVSMDGVGATYEKIRRRSFDDLTVRMERLGDIVPFGINYVVNSDTIADLDQALDLAEVLGAREFLLLPERSTFSRPGIDELTSQKLRVWASEYRGQVALAVSGGNADGLPTCDPFPFEIGLAAFSHIDATGFLKASSFDTFGTKIDSNGVLSALRILKTKPQIFK